MTGEPFLKLRFGRANNSLCQFIFLGESAWRPEASTRRALAVRAGSPLEGARNAFAITFDDRVNLNISRPWQPQLHRGSSQ